MIAIGDSASHEEAWLALPWLANGRISQAERDRIEPHVRTCRTCREELAFQRLLCNTLTAPERVTYAPGPSFRKLMDRIDGNTPRSERNKSEPAAPAVPRARGNVLNISLWRPPGLAWAASFVLMVGLAGVVTSVYHQSQSIYRTHSDPSPSSSILHIAFDRSVTIGEAEEVLHSAGAQIVEGPDSTGVFGVLPGAVAGDQGAPDPYPSLNMNRELRVLSARLRADPRVRWVAPIAENSSSTGQDSTPRGP